MCANAQTALVTLWYRIGAHHVAQTPTFLDTAGARQETCVGAFPRLLPPFVFCRSANKLTEHYPGSGSNTSVRLDRGLVRRLSGAQVPSLNGGYVRGAFIHVVKQERSDAKV
jgi:hypothetical protein